MLRPELTTGMPGIDAQHQELFRRAGAVDIALSEGRFALETLGMLRYLADHCKAHFALEQRLMYHLNYPAITDHLAQHTWFTKTIRRIELDLGSGVAPDDVAMRLNELVLSWFVKHIGDADKRLGVFLRPE